MKRIGPFVSAAALALLAGALLALGSLRAPELGGEELWQSLLAGAAGSGLGGVVFRALQSCLTKRRAPDSFSHG